MLVRNNEMIASPEIYLMVMAQMMKLATEYQEQTERYTKEVQKENRASYKNHSRIFKHPHHNKNHHRVHQPQTGKHRRHI